MYFMLVINSFIINSHTEMVILSLVKNDKLKALSDAIIVNNR